MRAAKRTEVGYARDILARRTMERTKERTNERTRVPGISTFARRNPLPSYLLSRVRMRIPHPVFDDDDDDDPGPE